MFLRKECCKQSRYYKFEHKCQLRSSGIQKYKLHCSCTRICINPLAMLPTSCNMEVNFFPGDNKYIMGDQISDVDCAAFGVIGSIYWASPSTDRGNALLKGTGSQTYCLLKM